MQRGWKGYPSNKLTQISLKTEYGSLRRMLLKLHNFLPLIVLLKFLSFSIFDSKGSKAYIISTLNCVYSSYDVIQCCTICDSRVDINLKIWLIINILLNKVDCKRISSPSTTNILLRTSQLSVPHSHFLFVTQS